MKKIFSAVCLFSILFFGSCSSSRYNANGVGCYVTYNENTKHQVLKSAKKQFSKIIKTCPSEEICIAQ